MDFIKEIAEAGKGSSKGTLPFSDEAGYPVMFNTAKTETSDAGNEMLVVWFKIKPVTAEEKVTLKELKGREVRNNYVFSEKYARELLGEMINAFGGDTKKLFKGLSGLEEYAETVQDFFDEISPKPTCRVQVSDNPKNPKYPKLFFKFGEEVTEEVEETEDEDDEVLAP